MVSKSEQSSNPEVALERAHLGDRYAIRHRPSPSNELLHLPVACFVSSNLDPFPEKGLPTRMKIKYASGIVEEPLFLKLFDPNTFHLEEK